MALKAEGSLLKIFFQLFLLTFLCGFGIMAPVFQKIFSDKFLIVVTRT